MERFDRKDLRFILICFLVIVGGALITEVLFHRAFPEASIEFRVNRSQARALAEKFLASRGCNVVADRFAGRFGVDEEPKVYLERELGLERASQFYGRQAKVWHWQMRWFRSGLKEEHRVSMTPLGDLASFQSVLREDSPGARLSREEARSLSRNFLASRSLAADPKPIEATPVARPRRTDWTFVDEKRGLAMGEATVRYSTTVSGDQVTGFREFVHVPEAWTRDYQRLRSKNLTANQVGNLGLFVTFLAMLGVLVTKIVRKDVRWGLVGVFGAIAFLLSLLSILNGLPLTLYSYDTASPLSSFLASRILFGFLAAIGVGAGIAMVVAAAEPVYRERFPQQLSLTRMFSVRGLRSKRFFRGVLLGYALTAFFFAYQAVFYVVAARLGAWAPAEIPYDDILNTAFPWVTVLFIGFLPAVLEEGSSRMFSISFLDRLGAGRVIAVVLPAVIWGFNHAAYPNQPYYIRGVEVGVAGILIGVIMLRYGILPLLVWHFTVDALYTALLLLRSGNSYYVISGAASSLILLLPLAISLLWYWRRGGFEAEAGLTNGEEGFVPRPALAPTGPESVPAIRPVPKRLWALLGAAAAFLAASFLVPTRPSGDLVQDATGRVRAEGLARSFLRANGISIEHLRMVSYLGTGFTGDDDLRSSKPSEFGGVQGFSEGAARYVLSQGGWAALERLAEDRLPLNYWVVRFFESEKKEEWKVLIDTRRARVVGFVNPTEEKATRGPAPSAERARQRVRVAAVGLGYPADSYSVLEVGTQDRPKRTDTTVVLESRPPGIGRAWPRLTAVFHGSRLACFLPSIWVPEDFLREYRKRLTIDSLLTVLKVVAIGGVIGIGFVLFLRIVRLPEFRWRSLLHPILVFAPLAAAAVANSFPSVLRAYQTATPLSLFRIGVLVSLIIAWMFLVCLAGIVFILYSGARPGWRRALRMGSLGDAVARAAIAAVGLAAVERWVRVAAGRFPERFDFNPSLPQALERAIPGFSAFWSAVLPTLGLAALASIVALVLARPLFGKTLGRLLAVAVGLLALLPTAFHSSGDFAAAYLPSVLAACWLTIAGLLLLRDHAAAWLLFGVFAYGGPAVAGLLSQSAPEDRIAGWEGLLLLIVGVAAVLAGRRGKAEVVPSTPPDSGMLSA